MERFSFALELLELVEAMFNILRKFIFPAIRLLSTGLVKKFIRVFPIRCHGKTPKNFLAQPSIFVAVLHVRKRPREARSLHKGPGTGQQLPPSTCWYARKRPGVGPVGPGVVIRGLLRLLLDWLQSDDGPGGGDSSWCAGPSAGR